MQSIIDTIKNSLYSCNNIQEFTDIQKTFMMKYPQEYKIAIEQINKELN